MVGTDALTESPAAQSVFVSDLDGEPADVNTHSRVGKGTDSGVGDICISSGLEAHERGGLHVDETVLDVGKYRDQICRLA